MPSCLADRIGLKSCMFVVQRTLKAVDIRSSSCPANIKQGNTGACCGIRC